MSMASPDTPQNMAAMSCCPGGAVAMLGVGLGHMLAGSMHRLAARRARRRELHMLKQMWAAECASPATRRV
ncbi:hypothetical protein GCM10009619_18000 [Williamsia maris]